MQLCQISETKNLIPTFICSMINDQQYNRKCQILSVRSGGGSSKTKVKKRRVLWCVVVRRQAPAIDERSSLGIVQQMTDVVSSVRHIQTHILQTIQHHTHTHVRRQTGFEKFSSANQQVLVDAVTNTLLSLYVVEMIRYKRACIDKNITEQCTSTVVYFYLLCACTVQQYMEKIYMILNSIL